VVGLGSSGFSGNARHAVFLGVALVGALAAACGRSQSKAGVEGSGGEGGSEVVATGGTETGGSGTGGTGTGGATGGQAGTIGEAGGAGGPEACTPSVRVAPMRQLTRFQYGNVLRDMLGDESGIAQRLPQSDLDVDLALDGTASPEWVAELHVLAHDFAVASTESSTALSAALGCDLEADGEAACKARLLEVVLPRLFRRPLDAEDVEQFEALLVTGAELGGDFASGVRMALEVALQSPEVVYRPELGEPLDVPQSDPRSGWARPSPFEMASRLSFLLWGSAPDDALLAEASAGGLRTKEEVRSAALRMLDDERAAALMRYVHLRLLRLLDRALPPEEWDPDYTEAIFLLMQSETAAFLDDVSSSGAGGFERLLTAPYTYLNEDLAAFYGIPNVAGSELRKVTLSSPPYSGILTQGSFLSAHSWAGGTLPTHRGRAILEAFLCVDVAIPPVDPHSLEPLEPPVGLTTRDHFTQLTQPEPVCAGCHAVLDAPGFALEHFDHVGRYRDDENGLPIDTQVEVAIERTIARVDGAPGLGSLLAQSSVSHDCYVRHWAAYAYAASTDAPLDECSRAQLADVFERTNGDLRALLLELTQTDAFLYRAQGEL
jgi:hypothetical protein